MHNLSLSLSLPLHVFISIFFPLLFVQQKICYDMYNFYLHTSLHLSYFFFVATLLVFIFCLV